MDVINAFFSVNTIAFTILGYSISWLELVGTIFNLVCVILAARRNIWNWPIGLIGVMLFFVMRAMGELLLHNLQQQGMIRGDYRQYVSVVNSLDELQRQLEDYA